MTSVQVLSAYDRCVRLPKLSAELTPSRLPIREAVRRSLRSGLSTLAATPIADRTDAIDTCITRFLSGAGSPGYLYPEGEPYVIAQDHAAWLGGALALVCEWAPFSSLVKPVAPYPMAGQLLDLDGWRDLLDNSIHLYRAPESVDSRPRWDEQLAAAMEPDCEVWVHCLRLPRVNAIGRLPSPLALGYENPIGGQIRLAKFETKKDKTRTGSTFSPRWRRVGRWERPDIPWTEWRAGIDADYCLDKCIQSWRSNAVTDEQTLLDIRRILREIEQSGMPPRRWEACSGCLYENWCHGSEEERESYVRIGTEDEQQDLQQVPPPEAAISVQP